MKNKLKKKTIVGVVKAKSSKITVIDPSGGGAMTSTTGYTSIDPSISSGSIVMEHRTMSTTGPPTAPTVSTSSLAAEVYREASEAAVRERLQKLEEERLEREKRLQSRSGAGRLSGYFDVAEREAGLSGLREKVSLEKEMKGRGAEGGRKEERTFFNPKTGKIETEVTERPLSLYHEAQVTMGSRTRKLAPHQQAIGGTVEEASKVLREGMLREEVKAIQAEQIENIARIRRSIENFKMEQMEAERKYWESVTAQQQNEEKMRKEIEEYNTFLSKLSPGLRAEMGGTIDVAKYGSLDAAYAAMSQAKAEKKASDQLYDANKYLASGAPDANQYLATAKANYYSTYQQTDPYGIKAFEAQANGQIAAVTENAANRINTLMQQAKMGLIPGIDPKYAQQVFRGSYVQGEALSKEQINLLDTVTGVSYQRASSEAMYRGLLNEMYSKQREMESLQKLGMMNHEMELKLNRDLYNIAKQIKATASAYKDSLLKESTLRLDHPLNALSKKEKEEVIKSIESVVPYASMLEETTKSLIEPKLTKEQIKTITNYNKNYAKVLGTPEIDIYDPEAWEKFLKITSSEKSRFQKYNSEQFEKMMEKVRTEEAAREAPLKPEIISGKIVTGIGALSGMFAKDAKSIIGVIDTGGLKKFFAKGGIAVGTPVVKKELPKVEYPKVEEKLETAKPVVKKTEIREEDPIQKELFGESYKRIQSIISSEKENLIRRAERYESDAESLKKSGDTEWATKFLEEAKKLRAAAKNVFNVTEYGDLLSKNFKDAIADFQKSTGWQNENAKAWLNIQNVLDTFRSNPEWQMTDTDLKYIRQELDKIREPAGKAGHWTPEGWEEGTVIDFDKWKENIYNMALKQKDYNKEYIQAEAKIPEVVTMRVLSDLMKTSELPKDMFKKDFSKFEIRDYVLVAKFMNAEPMTKDEIETLKGIADYESLVNYRISVAEPQTKVTRWLQSKVEIPAETTTPVRAAMKDLLDTQYSALVTSKINENLIKNYIDSGKLQKDEKGNIVATEYFTTQDRKTLDTQYTDSKKYISSISEKEHRLADISKKEMEYYSKPLDFGSMWLESVYEFGDARRAILSGDVIKGFSKLGSGTLWGAASGVSLLISAPVLAKTHVLDPLEHLTETHLGAPGQEKIGSGWKNVVSGGDIGTRISGALETNIGAGMATLSAVGKFPSMFLGIYGLGVTAGSVIGGRAARGDSSILYDLSAGVSRAPTEFYAGFEHRPVETLAAFTVAPAIFSGAARTVKSKTPIDIGFTRRFETIKVSETPSAVEPHWLFGEGRGKVLRTELKPVETFGITRLGLERLLPEETRTHPSKEFVHIMERVLRFEPSIKQAIEAAPEDMRGKVSYDLTRKYLENIPAEERMSRAMDILNQPAKYGIEMTPALEYNIALLKGGMERRVPPEAGIIERLTGGEYRTVRKGVLTVDVEWMKKIQSPFEIIRKAGTEPTAMKPSEIPQLPRGFGGLLGEAQYILGKAEEKSTLPTIQERLQKQRATIREGKDIWSKLMTRVDEGIISIEEIAGKPLEEMFKIVNDRVIAQREKSIKKFEAEWDKKIEDVKKATEFKNLPKEEQNVVLDRFRRLREIERMNLESGWSDMISKIEGVREKTFKARESGTTVDVFGIAKDLSDAGVGILQFGVGVTQAGKGKVGKAIDYLKSIEGIKRRSLFKEETESPKVFILGKRLSITPEIVKKESKVPDVKIKTDIEKAPFYEPRKEDTVTDIWLQSIYGIPLIGEPLAVRGHAMRLSDVSYGKDLRTRISDWLTTRKRLADVEDKLYQSARTFEEALHKIYKIEKRSNIADNVELLGKKWIEVEKEVPEPDPNSPTGTKMVKKKVMELVEIPELKENIEQNKRDSETIRKIYDTQKKIMDIASEDVITPDYGVNAAFIKNLEMDRLPPEKASALNSEILNLMRKYRAVLYGKFAETLYGIEEPGIHLLERGTKDADLMFFTKSDAVNFAREVTDIANKYFGKNKFIINEKSIERGGDGLVVENRDIIDPDTRKPQTVFDLHYGALKFSPIQLGKYEFEVSTEGMFKDWKRNKAQLFDKIPPDPSQANIIVVDGILVETLSSLLRRKAEIITEVKYNEKTGKFEWLEDKGRGSGKDLWDFVNKLEYLNTKFTKYANAYEERGDYLNANKFRQRAIEMDVIKRDILSNQKLLDRVSAYEAKVREAKGSQEQLKLKLESMGLGLKEPVSVETLNEAIGMPSERETFLSLYRASKPMGKWWWKGGITPIGVKQAPTSKVLEKVLNIGEHGEVLTKMLTGEKYGGKYSIYGGTAFGAGMEGLGVPLGEIVSALKYSGKGKPTTEVSDVGGRISRTVDIGGKKVNVVSIAEAKEGGWRDYIDYLKKSTARKGKLSPEEYELTKVMEVLAESGAEIPLLPKYVYSPLMSKGFADAVKRLSPERRGAIVEDVFRLMDKYGGQPHGASTIAVYEGVAARPTADVDIQFADRRSLVAFSNELLKAGKGLFELRLSREGKPVMEEIYTRDAAGNLVRVFDLGIMPERPVSLKKAGMGDIFRDMSKEERLKIEKKVALSTIEGEVSSLADLFMTESGIVPTYDVFARSKLESLMKITKPANVIMAEKILKINDIIESHRKSGTLGSSEAKLKMQQLQEILSEAKSLGINDVGEAKKVLDSWDSMEHIVARTRAYKDVYDCVNAYRNIAIEGRRLADYYKDTNPSASRKFLEHANRIDASLDKLLSNSVIRDLYERRKAEVAQNPVANVDLKPITEPVTMYANLPSGTYYIGKALTTPLKTLETLLVKKPHPKFEPSAQPSRLEDLTNVVEKLYGKKLGGTREEYEALLRKDPNAKITYEQFKELSQKFPFHTKDVDIFIEPDYMKTFLEDALNEVFNKKVPEGSRKRYWIEGDKIVTNVVDPTTGKTMTAHVLDLHALPVEYKRKAYDPYAKRPGWSPLQEVLKVRLMKSPEGLTYESLETSLQRYYLSLGGRGVEFGPESHRGKDAFRLVVGNAAMIAALKEQLRTAPSYRQGKIKSYIDILEKTNRDILLNPKLRSAVERGFASYLDRDLRLIHEHDLWLAGEKKVSIMNVVTDADGKKVLLVGNKRIPINIVDDRIVVDTSRGDINAFMRMKMNGIEIDSYGNVRLEGSLERIRSTLKKNALPEDLIKESKMGLLTLREGKIGLIRERTGEVKISPRETPAKYADYTRYAATLAPVIYRGSGYAKTTYLPTVEYPSIVGKYPEEYPKEYPKAVVTYPDIYSKDYKLTYPKGYPVEYPATYPKAAIKYPEIYPREYKPAYPAEYPRGYPIGYPTEYPKSVISPPPPPTPPPRWAVPPPLPEDKVMRIRPSSVFSLGVRDIIHPIMSEEEMLGQKKYKLALPDTKRWTHPKAGAIIQYEKARFFPSWDSSFVVRGRRKVKETEDALTRFVMRRNKDATPTLVSKMKAKKNIIKQNYNFNIKKVV